MSVNMFKLEKLLMILMKSDMHVTPCGPFKIQSSLFHILDNKNEMAAALLPHPVSSDNLLSIFTKLTTKTVIIMVIKVPCFSEYTKLYLHSDANSQSQGASNTSTRRDYRITGLVCKTGFSILRNYFLSLSTHSEI
jgi:hypothetical protein